MTLFVGGEVLGAWEKSCAPFSYIQTKKVLISATFIP